MKIGMDFGGVIADHLSIRMKEAKTLWGIELTPETAQRDALLPRIGETAYADLVHRGGLRIADVPLHDSVREALAELKADGHRLVVVSMQTHSVSEQSLHGFLTDRGLPMDKVCVVGSDEDKFARCQEEGVELFLDDQPNVLEILVSLRITLAWANFYQLKAPANLRFHEVRSWPEFTRWVKDLRVPKKTM